MKFIQNYHLHHCILLAILTLLTQMIVLTNGIESLDSQITHGIDSKLNKHNDSDQVIPLASILPELMSETTVSPSTIEESLLNSSYFTTEINSNSSATTTTSALSDSLLPSGSENRLRWVDFRRPAYPPRMPAVHGIPSGFRNPLTPVFNPGMPQHMTGFGGSSTQPVGFGGSVVMSNHYGTPQSTTIRRPHINITRVEHISAECSDDYMKVIIHYNGTFMGLVYSSGYVHDPNCIYVNGTGRNHYEFFIRLNQCGTLGRQEMYNPKMPGEARRRDQLMWNTLSIQYNALIEEEWDEHFRVTCEYGSDFWRTVTFPSVSVEVNTGSPVVFTINPPQCQMEIRRGFGTSGTRTSGPVTVGDPLTLLIHMKSEKAGFDILVKNCIAHNGAQQRLVLIDSNGCVTNEKLISPFRGTYNADDGHQVSLYAYLKAFRFTGSPALYLECDIHMCHNKCPPQRCYWRNLSKRSADLKQIATEGNSTAKQLVSDSISLFQALEVRQEPDKNDVVGESPVQTKNNQHSNDLCFRPEGVATFLVSMFFLLTLSSALSIGCCMKMRRIKQMHRHMIDASSLYKNSYDNIYQESRLPFTRRF